MNTRIEVLRGGALDDAEAAAVVSALVAVAPRKPGSEPVPAWRLAALQEAVGGTPLRSAQDVILLRR